LSAALVNLLIRLMVILIVLYIAYTIVSFVVFDPSLTWDQRVIGGAIAMVFVALLLGVTVKCMFKGGSMQFG